ncbi:MAG TPA: hypothetical protein VFG73_05250 [Rhodanobacteraceae bacterium]|nr:hypothetical protein [Rhodanobacteraceae bacterium]
MLISHKTLSITLFVLALVGCAIGNDGTTGASDAPQLTNICAIARNPSAYEGDVVRVKGSIFADPHGQPFLGSSQCRSLLYLSLAKLRENETFFHRDPTLRALERKLYPADFPESRPHVPALVVGVVHYFQATRTITIGAKSIELL